MDSSSVSYRGQALWETNEVGYSWKRVSSRYRGLADAMGADRKRDSCEEKDICQHSTDYEWKQGAHVATLTNSIRDRTAVVRFLLVLRRCMMSEK